MYRERRKQNKTLRFSCLTYDRQTITRDYIGIEHKKEDKKTKLLRDFTKRKQPMRL